MCPQQYFCEYVLGWRGKSGIKADKGTIVHKALEIIAFAQKAKQDKKKTFKDDIVGTVRVAKYDIDNLIKKVYKYYSEGTPYHNWSDKDLRDCTKWTWKAIELNDGMFDPRNRKIIAAEPHFDFVIDEPWANYEYDLNGKKVSGKLAMKGTVDLVTEVEDGVYEIIDWKTGRRLDWATGQEKTFARLQKDPQLRIYHYAATKLYPEAKQIIITIYFINDGGPFTICFPRSEIEKTKKMVQEKFEQIKATRIPRLKRSWKCGKICPQGMSTFEGTNIHPMVETRHGQVTQYGEYMTKCEQIRYEIQSKGIKKVTEEYTSPGHNVAHYTAPGTIE